MKFVYAKNGFGLVEVVIVTAIITTALFAFSQAGILSLRLLQTERENLEASLLAQEGIEAVRSVRDESWSSNIATLQNNVAYYPVLQNEKWVFATTSPGTINGKYTRYILFNQVYRDLQDKITTATTTVDTGTKIVTSRVTWSGKQKDLMVYLTDFQSSLNQPTEAKTIYYEGGTTDANLGAFPSNNAGDGDPVQSFTTTGAIRATKAELYLRRATAAPSDVYAEIRTSATGTVLAASNIISATTIGSTTLSWVEFRFPDPVSLAATTKYFIRLRSTPAATDAGSGSRGTIDWGYLQTVSSPYSGGDAIRYVGRLSNPSDAGQTLTQYDFSFRIYALQ